MTVEAASDLDLKPQMFLKVQAQQQAYTQSPVMDFQKSSCTQGARVALGFLAR